MGVRKGNYALPKADYIHKFQDLMCCDLWVFMPFSFQLQSKVSIYESQVELSPVGEQVFYFI